MTRVLRILLCLLVASIPLPAIAQQRPAPGTPGAPGAPGTAQANAGGAEPDAAASAGGEPKTKEQLKAQQHFQRAKDLYQAGSYREAIPELEAARLLDPKAKELVFNLGIVHEKLGKYDEAIAFFRQYIDLESVTGAERAKAENIIKRIEGAKREVPVATAPSPAPTGPARDDTRPRGRIDAATIAAGSVAVVGFGIGSIFGILAVSNKPGDGSFVTGRDGSYADLQTKSDNAHTQAIVADIGFGVGLAALVATAILYFGRPKEPPRANHPSPRLGALGGTF